MNFLVPTSYYDVAGIHRKDILSQGRTLAKNRTVSMVRETVGFGGSLGKGDQ